MQLSPPTNPRLLPVLLALALATCLLIISPDPTLAHAVLQRSDPAAGSSQVDPPRTVELWFTEEIDPQLSAISVSGPGGVRVDIGGVVGDPDDPTHLTVQLPDLAEGVYTVEWQTVSLVDQHPVQGSFAFGVGSVRLPGAAVEVDQLPPPWTVVLRWLTLLGLAFPTGWFLIRWLGVPAKSGYWLAVVGVVAALVADLSLVPVLTYLPESGLPSLSIGDTLRAMPSSWFVRLGLDAVLVAYLVSPVAARAAKPLLTTGTLLSSGAVLTMTFTSHAAASERVRILAMAISAIHLLVVALWIGGLLHFAVSPATWRHGVVEPLRRFSRLSIVLAPVALLSGLAVAGVTFPTVKSVWQSGYGQVLLLKVVVVLTILTAAWINRQRVRANLERVRRLARSLRAEAALAGTAILLASILALSAPPAPAKQVPLHLRSAVDQERNAHLVLDPPEADRLTVEAWLTRGEEQPDPGVERVEVRFSSLDQAIDLPPVTLEEQRDGHWGRQNVHLSVRGWWRVVVHFFGPESESEAASAEFVMLLPDPALTGTTLNRSPNPEAQAVFDAAIERLRRLTSLRIEEELGGGRGNSVKTQYTYQAPNQLRYVTSSGNVSVAAGFDQWARRGDRPWRHWERPHPFRFPDDLPTFYTGATQFTLGRQESIDGELCQIVSFYVPADTGRDEAWYTWWVGVQSKLIRREAMVANFHYMTHHLTDHDAKVEITVPPTQSP